MKWPDPSSARLFALIQPALAALPKELDWTLGGGTALAMWLNHRKSKDIDLFFESSASLRLLSPQRNPLTKPISKSAQEPGHYLKFEVPGIGEIDILVTRSWTDSPASVQNVEGMQIALQHPAEIIARKIAYRSASFKLRDFFDLAAVASEQPDQLIALQSVARPHLDGLQARWVGLSARLPGALAAEVTPVGVGLSIASNLRRIVDAALARLQEGAPGSGDASSSPSEPAA